MKSKKIFLCIAIGFIFLLAACERKENADIQACKKEYDKFIKTIKTFRDTSDKKKKSADNTDTKIYFQSIQKSLNLIIKQFENEKSKAYDECKKDPNQNRKQLKESPILKNYKKYYNTALNESGNVLAISVAKLKASTIKKGGAWKLDDEDGK